MLGVGAQGSQPGAHMKLGSGHVQIKGPKHGPMGFFLLDKRMGVLGTMMLIAVILAWSATTADASPITIGSPLTQVFAINGRAPGGGSLVNTALPEPGAHVVSPIDGVIVRWRLLAASGNFGLRVVKPEGGTTYSFFDPMVLSGPVGPDLTILPADLPIHAGETIALNYESGNGVGMIHNLPGAGSLFWHQHLAPATEEAIGEERETEVAFNADVQPAPMVQQISPAFGSIKGGTAVTVAGTDFANVSGVSFGGVPAASFTVANEGQLMALAPAVEKAGAVDVTVTTIAGTTPVTAADRFTYEACVVPKLNGKSLKAAEKKLRKASCKLGKVKHRKGATSKTGKVVKQSPRPGKQLLPGSKVTVTLAG